VTSEIISELVMWNKDVYILRTVVCMTKGTCWAKATANKPHILVIVELYLTERLVTTTTI